MLTTYHTIAKSGVSEIVIKGSRFICSLKRVHSEDEAKAFKKKKVVTLWITFRR